MRIDSIDIFRVNMVLAEPFRTACGDDYDNEAVLVRMTSDGVSGWGESAPGSTPTYAPECGASLYVIARDFIAPELIGQDIPSGYEIHVLLDHIRGNRFAKAAFDIAWWDLQAKMKGVPLWKLIGGRRREIEAGADFGVMDTHKELIAKIEGAVSQGYRRVKLKCRPGWDIDMVAAVRERFPHTTFHVDCNSAYTPTETELFQEMDRFNLAMIEQPLAHDDLIDHAILQGSIETPICLDESIDSAAKARKAVMVGSCRWINIKPGRVGGITPALVVHEICRDAGIGCWVGGMLESSVGAHVCLALATLPNILYPSDVFPSSRFYARDLGRPAMEHSAPGMFTAPDVPGCGAEPDPAMLERLTIETVSVKA